MRFLCFWSVMQIYKLLLFQYRTQLILITHFFVSATCKWLCNLEPLNDQVHLSLKSSLQFYKSISDDLVKVVIWLVQFCFVLFCSSVCRWRAKVSEPTWKANKQINQYHCKKQCGKFHSISITPHILWITIVFWQSDDCSPLTTLFADEQRFTSFWIITFQVQQNKYTFHDLCWHNM